MQKFRPSSFESFTTTLFNAHPSSMSRRKMTTESSTQLEEVNNNSTKIVPSDLEKIDAYWRYVLRQEEEALQKTRPWQRLDFIPAYNFKQLLSTFKGEFLHQNYSFVRKRYDERRALMDPNVLMLNYPFGPSTQPEGIDLNVWNEAFKQARLFILGTKHDTIQSIQAVRLLLGAVHADFVFLGLSQPQSELLIAANEDDLQPRLSKTYAKGFVAERLAKEGVDMDSFSFDQWSVRPNLEKMHYIHQYATKYMVRWSEFAEARAYLAKTYTNCAGFVLGLPPEEKLDRLVDLAEEYLLEEILLKLNRDRVPQFGEDFQLKIMEWVKELAKKAQYRTTFLYKYHTHMPVGRQSARWKRLPIDKFPDLQRLFDEFIDEEFPGYRAARVARQNRFLMRSLQTLVHRTVVEKLCAAEKKKVPIERLVPATIIAIVCHRHLPGIQEIWDQPEEIYKGVL